MATESYRLNGVQILDYFQAGARLHTAQDAVDAIGEALAPGADIVVIPAEIWTPGFSSCELDWRGRLFRNRELPA